MNKSQEQTGPIAETFEKELNSIKEKGKDLKGEQRDFYNSIVQRLENNEQVITDLRTEHTNLRAQLNDLVREKKEIGNVSDLPSDIKRTSHRVNLMKKQLDKIKHKRQEAVERQGELSIILKNYEGENPDSNPEFERLNTLKNKIDNVKIKNQETDTIMKSYNKIIHYLERQKMHWNSVLTKHNGQIEQKQKDIRDLTLVARDSQHSRNTATNEFIRTQNANAQSHRKREDLIASKVQQLHSNMRPSLGEEFQEPKISKAQQSLNSQPSVVRNRINRQQRDMKEQRFQTISGQYEDIREFFGTNDPDEILTFFEDRRKQAVTFQNQIDELDETIRNLQRSLSQRRSQLEEIEYSSAKGVGSNRILIEGKRKLTQDTETLREAKAFAKISRGNNSRVIAGVFHLADEMELVSVDGNIPEDPIDVLQWVKENIKRMKTSLEQEDTDFVTLCNPTVLARKANDPTFDIHQVDSSHRNPRQRTVDPLKRPPRDNKGEYITRVLDRRSIKTESQKAAEDIAKAKKTK